MDVAADSADGAHVGNVTVLGRPDLAEPIARGLAPLFAAFDRHPVFTLVCATALFEAASRTSAQKSDQEVLSSSAVFIALIRHATHLTFDPQREGISAEAEEDAVLRSWGNYLNETPEQLDRLNELVNDLYEPSLLSGGSSLREPHRTEVWATELGPTLRRVLAPLSGRPPIRADALARALLADPGSYLGPRVEKFRLQPLADFILTEETSASAPKGDAGARAADAASPAPSSAPPRDTTRARRATRIVREADDDELGLGIEQYARALATIMRSAKGEFAFALFGPWGSGKTTLARRTVPLLESAATFRAGQNFSEGDPIANRNYAVVGHSAWKYRRTPEAWIFLYKSLVDHVGKSCGVLGRWAIALRASARLHTRAPIFLSLSAIALAALPLLAKLHLAVALASLVGLTSVLYLLSVIGGTTHKVKALFNKHVKLSSHDDKLGMLALLGDDVRALLGAWIPETNVGPADERKQAKRRLWRDAGGAALFIVVISAVWLLGLYLESRPMPDTTDALSPLRGTLSSIAKPACDLGIFEPASVFCVKSEVGKEVQTPERGGVSTLHVLFFLFWFCLASALLLLPIVHRRGLPDRIMLIVDDLDRCDPDEMLEIIEALKLLLEEPFVQQRLQALMLVDEDFLEHAIAHRFRRLIAERSELIAQSGDASTSLIAAKRQVVAEHVEKLFACHLRVPRLGEGEMAEAVELHAGRELRAQILKGAEAFADRVIAANPAKLPEELFKQSIPVMSNPAERALPAAAARADADRSQPSPVHDVSFSDNDLRFQRNEIDVIKGLVPGYFAATHRRPSQRAIKALLFKVQLCHLLLQLRAGHDPAPEVAMELIVDALSGAKHQDSAIGRSVDWVAAQVA
jgi:hypothetical protein